MKKVFSAALASICLAGSSIPAIASEANEVRTDQLSISANTPLGSALTFTKDSSTENVDILEHEGTFNTVAIGSESAVLSTNASGSSDNVAAALATSSELALAWDFDGSQQVQISIDGEPVGVEANQGSMTLFGGEITEDSQVTFLQLDEANDETELTTFEMVSLPLAQPVESSLLAATQTFAAATVSPPAATVLRYQTFILDDFVGAPLAGCDASNLRLLGWDPYYKGNNRTYSAGSSNNKTAMQVNIGWDTATVTSNKTVQATDIYLKNTYGTYDFYQRKQASTSGMTVTNGTFYTNSVYVHLHHDIENPDCDPAGLGIFYDVAGKIYRSGGYSLSGDFRQAPWHEFYIKDSNYTTWKYIYRADINPDWRFDCFNPIVNCMKSGAWDTPNSVWYH